MKTITQLTRKDIQALRRKNYGTNGKNITVTYQEVKDMQKHLQTLYTGGIQMSFAEKIACRNKEYIDMKVTEQFEKEITPFFWVEHEESASVCLNVGEYLQEIFDTRADEGFEGNGYDWGSLAQVFLDEQCLDLQEKICFDPESSMFCVYSKDKNALADFILRFKKACEDKSFILDLFSRAELD